MIRPDNPVQSGQTVYHGEYDGILTTYASTTMTTAEDIRKIQQVVKEVAAAASVHKNVFKVLPNRDLAVNFFWMTRTFPNLFLPEEDRTESSETSFDSVISYLMYRLIEEGYPYNGQIVFLGDAKQWKLRVKYGEVFLG